MIVVVTARGLKHPTLMLAIFTIPSGLRHLGSLKMVRMRFGPPMRAGFRGVAGGLGFHIVVRARAQIPIPDPVKFQNDQRSKMYKRGANATPIMQSCPVQQREDCRRIGEPLKLFP